MKELTDAEMDLQIEADRKAAHQPRREICLLLSERMSRLSPQRAAHAFAHLSGCLKGMADLDVPKWRHLADGLARACAWAESMTPEQAESPCGTPEPRPDINVKPPGYISTSEGYNPAQSNL